MTQRSEDCGSPITYTEIALRRSLGPVWRGGMIAASSKTSFNIHMEMSTYPLKHNITHLNKMCFLNGQETYRSLSHRVLRMFLTPSSKNISLPLNGVCVMCYSPVKGQGEDPCVNGHAQCKRFLPHHEAFLSRVWVADTDSPAALETRSLNLKYRQFCSLALWRITAGLY